MPKAPTAAAKRPEAAVFRDHGSVLLTTGDCDRSLAGQAFDRQGGEDTVSPQKVVQLFELLELDGACAVQCQMYKPATAQRENAAMAG